MTLEGLGRSVSAENWLELTRKARSLARPDELRLAQRQCGIVRPLDASKDAALEPGAGEPSAKPQEQSARRARAGASGCAESRFEVEHGGIRHTSMVRRRPSSPR